MATSKLGSNQPPAPAAVCYHAATQLGRTKRASAPHRTARRLASMIGKMMAEKATRMLAARQSGRQPARVATGWTPLPAKHS